MNKKYFTFLILLTSTIFILSLGWNVFSILRNINERAENRLKTFSKIIEALINWNVNSGGVYIPISSKSLSKEHYNKEIETKEGTKLALINPSYMTGQIALFIKDDMNIKIRNTSINPINEDNKPDEWELKALKTLSSGKEWFFQKEINASDEAYRFMYPLYFKEQCKSCHIYKNYKIGELRGGISLIISTRYFDSIRNRRLLRVFIFHIIIYINTLFILFYFRNKLNQSFRKIKESEEEFRWIFEKAGSGIVFADMKGYFIKVNSVFADFLEYAPVDMVKMSFTEITHPDDLSKEIIYFNEINENKRDNYQLEKRYITKSKKIIWVDLAVSVIRDEKKNPLYFIGIINNITKRILYENALKRSEEKYRKLFANMQDAFISSKISGEIISINPALLKMLGYNSEEELLGKDVSELVWVYPNEREKFIEKIKKEGYVRNYKSTFKRKDGSTFIVEGNIYLTKDESGNPFAAQAIIRDMTEREKYEEQLQTLNSTKDKFFSIIAHDLRNPFNSIIGYAELLSKCVEENDKIRMNEYLDVIINSSKQAHSLLENLLLWSRTQTRNIEFSPELADLKMIIDVTIKLVVGQAANKNIEIKSNVQNELYVYCDKNIVSAIIRNLLVNAIKFTRVNGLVSIELKASDTYYNISVKDNGVGIPVEKINNLFKIESKFTSIGTNGEKGTGLGLILCKEFIQIHHGEIWVTSEVGKGSEFNFTLPKSPPLKLQY